jgi:hypothetical protein
MAYSITPISASVNEGAGSVSFTITRPESLLPETLFISTAANPSQSNINDYTEPLYEPVMFAPGQVSATVTIEITNDDIPEHIESFVLIAGQIPNNNSIVAEAFFSIFDDDTNITKYSIAPDGASASEGVDGLFFQITRMGALPPETVFVSTTTNRGYVNSGDYIGLVNQHVTFEAGQTRAMVQVQMLDDGVAENDERFGLIVQRDAADPLTTVLPARPSRSPITIRHPQTM